MEIWFLQLINVSLSAQEDDSLLKCLIELAENVPKVLRPHMETVFPFCLKASSHPQHLRFHIYCLDAAECI